jgi:iron-sulfur cluster assembly protein
MITVTDSATKRIVANLTKRGKGLGIRLGVRTTGCSGLAYVLEYVDKPTDSDICVECNGCKLFIDAPIKVNNNTRGHLPKNEPMKNL